MSEHIRQADPELRLGFDLDQTSLGGYHDWHDATEVADWYKTQALVERGPALNWLKTATRAMRAFVPRLTICDNGHRPGTVEFHFNTGFSEDIKTQCPTGKCDVLDFDPASEGVGGFKNVALSGLASQGDLDFIIARAC